MEKLKKICSITLCVVMTLVFTISPKCALVTQALDVAPTATASVSGDNIVSSIYAQFEKDLTVTASLSQTTSPLATVLEATIEYKDGNITKTISSDSITKTTSETNATDITFTFDKASLNLLPVGTYEINAASTIASANSVAKQKIGTLTVSNITPVVTIEKQISLTTSRSNFEGDGEQIKVKLDKAIFAAANPVSLELTAAIKNNTTSLTAKTSVTANGDVTFIFNQNDLNKLPEGIFSIVVSSAGNIVNGAILETTVGTLTITAMKNATVVTPQSFDIAKPNDVVIGVENNGHTLTAIRNSEFTLAKGTDYTVSDGYVTISKTYLSKFTKGSQYFTFDYDNGSDPICEVEITKTVTLLNVTLTGYNNLTVAILPNQEAGTKLPDWSKSKYKAAGQKGYKFAGWLYNGKVVTTVPESDSDITLTAKFTKLTVGKAASLTVTGKAGKGVGFIATSKIYTKADGSRRGFRFRYSLKSNMKSSTYKTTGLAKNTLTKTGLTKKKTYYVQVRYYYYDSTNSKVYGAYSNSKAVKAY